MKAVGHWLYAMGAKNITKAIDRNRSSSLIGPHQGRGGRAREKKQQREGKVTKRNEGKKTQKSKSVEGHSDKQQRGRNKDKTHKRKRESKNRQEEKKGQMAGDTERQEERKS